MPIVGNWQMKDYAPIPTGLVAHYRFVEEQSAGDDPPPAHTQEYALGVEATPNTTTSALSATSPFWRCFDFNGTNFYVDCNQTFESTFQDKFSIAIWFNADDGQPSSDSVLFGSHYISSPALNEHWVELRLSTDGRLSFDYTAVTSVSAYNQFKGSTQFTDGVATGWHHVVAVMDHTISGAGGLKIYLDGTLETAYLTNTGDLGSQTPSNYSGLQNPYIGVLRYRPQGGPASVTSYFDGKIDEVMVFSIAVTAAEALSLYNSWHGQKVTDGSVNANHGYYMDWDTSTAGRTFSKSVPGDVNAALLFDGGNDVVIVQDDSAINFGTSSYTIETRCRYLDISEDAYMVAKGDSYQLGVREDFDSKWQLLSGNGAIMKSVFSNSAAVVGQWYHVVGTRADDGTLKLYIDGILQDDTTDVLTVDITSTDVLLFGCDTLPSLGNVPSVGQQRKFANCEIDYVILYDKALNKNEVLSRAGGAKFRSRFSNNAGRRARYS